jgi:hypothetical protein
MQVMQHRLEVVGARAHLVQHDARQAGLFDIDTQLAPDQEAHPAAQAVDAREAGFDVQNQRHVHAAQHLVEQLALGREVGVDQPSTTPTRAAISATDERSKPLSRKTSRAAARISLHGAAGAASACRRRWNFAVA